MPTDIYMIELPHTIEDCDKAIQLVHISGYIKSFGWACHHGDHTGYMIGEFDNASQAKQILPPILREKAIIKPLSKFTDEDMDKMRSSHEKHGK